MLSNAGDHVPVIPLFEVVGKALSAAPEQMGATAEKEGTTGAITVMPVVVGFAHCPGFGVNVYITVPVEDVFIVEGDHVPVMPLLDVVAKAEGEAF